MKKRVSRSTPVRPVQKDGVQSTESLFQSWSDFWFRPTDTIRLHAIRFLTGILYLAWLLPFAGQLDAMFSMQGWFDQQAYHEAAQMPEGMRPQVDWSILFLCGSSPTLLRAAYTVSLAVLTLFTLGIATRLTAVLTWIVVVSFTANPATHYDADTLLVIPTFYLMIGYVFQGQRQRGLSLGSRLLGGRETWLIPSPSNSPERQKESVAANVAMRLMQVHLAIAIVSSGLHKLQFGDWWAGVAFWYPLYPPFATTLEQARTHLAQPIPFLVLISVAAYATLGWQIAFPLFAWKPRCRVLLLTGAGIGWLGSTFLYELPLFGPIIFIGCLSYLAPDEWRRICALMTKIPSYATAR